MFGNATGFCFQTVALPGNKPCLGAYASENGPEILTNPGLRSIIRARALDGRLMVLCFSGQGNLPVS